MIWGVRKVTLSEQPWCGCGWQTCKEELLVEGHAEVGLEQQKNVLVPHGDHR